jgi:multimeric flavodoxin WrbA
MTGWKCSVCGYVWNGSKPPKNCPQCGSPSGEFSKSGTKARLEVKQYDVLLINGSSHRSHNTAILADIAEAELKKKGLTCARIDLNGLEIQHCWCCYSMSDADCTYPCRNQLDDMPALHEMIVKSRAVIVASPINWNNMSARLKDFLDRLTALQNQTLLGKKSLTAGKVLGILVNGHEDGAMKTAMDIFVYFQQMGFIMAPFGFAYATHGAGNNANTDNRYFKGDKKLRADIAGLVNNVAEMLGQNLEQKMKGKLVSVSE